MKILILGYSSIFQRRGLAALTAIPDVTALAVATRSRAAQVNMPATLPSTVYEDYETALAESGADLVYVSTVNSLHVRWAEAALQRGMHVVIDKPATMSLADTERLIHLAQQQGVCLAEATVYGYHPQIQAIRDVFSEAGSAPTRITAAFCIPPLPVDDFRYQADLGGGALWDMSIRPISAGRLFFGAEPERVECVVLERERGVDVAFSVLLTYGRGRALVGHFGFTTGYRNHVTLLGPDVTIRADRIFTTPPTLRNTLRVNVHNHRDTVEAPPADTFTMFWRDVVDAVSVGDTERFIDVMLYDAQGTQRLFRSAGIA